MSKLKEGNDARRKVFATNLNTLIEQEMRLNKIDAATTLGVDYGWLRKSCSVGLVRPDNRSLAYLTKIAKHFHLRVEDLWKPDLLPTLTGPYTEKVLVILASSKADTFKRIIEDYYSMIASPEQPSGGTENV